MIIVRLLGGIGNQLFQYSFALFLIDKYKCKVVFDNGSYKSVDKNRKCEIDLINSKIDFHVYPKLFFSHYRGILNRLLLYLYKFQPNKKYVKDSPSFNFDSIKYDCNKEYYFDGYWQYPDIVEKVNENLPKLFYPNQELPECLKSIHTKILKDKNSVAIHVRRGDYFTPKNINIYGVCDENYYHNAIKYLKKNGNKFTYYIFTDDTEWCKNNLKIKGNVIYVENKPVNNFWYIYLMSQCKHIIISNSTFSWWGAFLNKNADKIVISPKKWKLNDNKTIALKNWIKI